MNNVSWLWLAARGSGLVSLTLLTAVVLLGISTRAGWATRLWPRGAVTMLHRNLSMLAVVFLLVHISSSVIDGYVAIDFVDAVVPFATPYRTLWLGLGTIALDLILALIITSVLRRHLPVRFWRSVHLLAYGAWGLAIVHGIGAGTDRKITLVLTAVCATAVVGALGAQLRGTKAPHPGEAPDDRPPARPRHEAGVRS